MVPFIAIQMHAYIVGGNFTLIFTKVMDELTLGPSEEEETAQATPADRAYWESKGSKATLAVVDQILSMVKELDPALELKYNKFYIGLAKDGQVNNFVEFVPRKNTLQLRLDIKQSEELDAMLEKAGLKTLDYDKRWGRYRIIAPDDVAKHRDLLNQLMRLAFESRAA
jgi:predicted transport protein